MAHEPVARYPDARALAADVECWLGDEPVAAYREAWPARLARWGRRHRPLVASASALLLTTLVALSVGPIALRRANTRTAKALTVAEDNFRMARAAVDRFFTRVSEDRILNEPGMDEFRGLVRADPGSADARLHLAMSSGMLGNLTCELGRPADAEAPQRLAVRIMEELVRTDRTDATYLRELATALTLLGHYHREVGRSTLEGDAYRRALVYQQELARLRPDDPEVRKGSPSRGAARQ